MRIAPAISLSSEQQATLEQWARSCSLPARVVERARIVLLAAHGQQDKQIAAALKITPKKVSRRRGRFHFLAGVTSVWERLIMTNEISVAERISRNPRARYLLALSAAAAALALGRTLGPTLGSHVPYVTVFAAIV